jgi:CRISPR/Cas system CSM-associated protein Csm3 (group 7 of RAMP superfamily)
MSAAQRLDLQYTVTWLGNWHVGSGFGTALADRRLRRRPPGRDEEGAGGGAPFVPGSQVKGVLRHQCERLAATLGCEVVDPHATGRDQQLRLVEHFAPLSRSRLIVDRLFGSRCQGDCLFVDNALPPPGTRAAGRDADLRPRVALDRVTGTALEGHLFVTEVAGVSALSSEEVHGPHLTGWIRGRHPPGVLTPYDGGFPYEYALLIAGLLGVEALGGDKSVGLGRCRVEVAAGTLSWNGRTISPQDALASFRDLEADWTDFLFDTRRGMQS